MSFCLIDLEIMIRFLNLRISFWIFTIFWNKRNNITEKCRELIVHAYCEYRDNAVYGNEAGNTWGKKLNCEGFTCDLAKSTDIKSAYAFNWEAFRNLNPATPEFARKRLEKLFDERFAYNMSLMF